MPEGIVLVRNIFREHDEVVSFITSDFGRVDVLARGVKKITSKLSPHLLPFSHVFFETVQGKEMAIITNVSSIDNFQPIREQYVKSLQAEFAAYALHRLTRPGNIDSGVFHLFYDWLRAVAHVGHISDCRFLDWLMLHSMGSIGFAPEYRTCVICGGTSDLLHWSFSGGGVVCRLHHTFCDSVFSISDGVRSDLTRLDQISLEDLLHTSDFAPQVHSIIVGHLQYHSEANIGNWSHACIEA